MRRQGAIITIIICFLLVTSAGAEGYKIGDVIDEIYYSDIVTFFEGKKIPSFNLGGRTAIVVEDLRDYGFDVIWDGNVRRLDVTFKGCANDRVGTRKELTNNKNFQLGEIVGKIYYSDITTYLNGQKIHSFNLGGRTGIIVEDLRNHGFDVIWNNSERTLHIIPQTKEYLKGYIIPKERIFEVVIPEEDTGLEIIMRVAYDKAAVVIAKQQEEIYEVLASKFDKEIALEILEYLKQKQSIQSGFESKAFYKGARVILVAGEQGSTVAGVGISFKDAKYLQPIELETPPFEYYTTVTDKDDIKEVKLKLISSESSNIHMEDWMQKNGLEHLEYEVPNPFRNIEGNTPDAIPVNYRGKMLVKAIKQDERIFLVYGSNFARGRYLICMDKNLQDFLYAYDFNKYIYPPGHEGGSFVYQRIKWAVEDEGVLYVAHSHLTYSESSDGMNAYITAIRLSDNSLLWRSQPLISSAMTFVVVGDVIISGYGFTNEEDYLYLTNKYTGKVIERIKLKTAPGYLMVKGDRLYVTCYDTNYVFQIEMQ